MTALLTFPGSSGQAVRSWAMGLVALLIAVAAPVVACEKSRSIAGQGEAQMAARFTGEFVNGAPVYRLPTITVVARRAIEVAEKPQTTARRQAARPDPSANPTTSTPKRKVANAAHGAIAIEPCIG